MELPIPQLHENRGDTINMLITQPHLFITHRFADVKGKTTHLSASLLGGFRYFIGFHRQPLIPLSHPSCFCFVLDFKAQGCSVYVEQKGQQSSESSCKASCRFIQTRKSLRRLWAKIHCLSPFGKVLQQKVLL